MIALSEFCLKKVCKPEIGKIYFCVDKEENALVPVMVISGQWESNGRLSNFWEWRNIHTGEKCSGYGAFWELRKYENEEE